MLALIKYAYLCSYNVYNLYKTPHYEEPPFVLLSQFCATFPSNVEICASKK
jgi:hypothetical protein